MILGSYDIELAVIDIIEDMCRNLMMKRDDRDSWRRLSYITVLRLFSLRIHCVACQVGKMLQKG